MYGQLVKRWWGISNLSRLSTDDLHKAHILINWPWVQSNAAFIGAYDEQTELSCQTHWFGYTVTYSNLRKQLSAFLPINDKYFVSVAANEQILVWVVSDLAVILDVSVTKVFYMVRKIRQSFLCFSWLDGKQIRSSAVQNDYQLAVVLGQSKLCNPLFVLLQLEASNDFKTNRVVDFDGWVFVSDEEVAVIGKH